MRKIRLALTCPEGHGWLTEAAQGLSAVPGDTPDQAGFHLLPECEYCPDCGKKWLRLALAKEG
jgi:hypothetical protein